MRALTLSDFDYALDESAIALEPADPADSAQLLALIGHGRSDTEILNLPNLLKRGDVLVFNDTKVIPARLFGRRGDAKVEVTLHKKLKSSDTTPHWSCFVRNAKRLRPQDIVTFADGFSAHVLTKNEDGSVDLAFKSDGAAFLDTLDAHGVMPLPPYIATRRPVGAQDNAHYQSMFASKPGAVAAPTASLHFTPRLIAALDEAGIQREIVTLHVGAGTFLPVKTDDIDAHKMHAEFGTVTDQTALRLMAAKNQGRRIIPVGTTALRVLEAAAADEGVLMPFEGETDLFIRPGYTFRFIDGLITNFHLPKSTLLMLVSALMGRERILEAYAHARDKGYRFFSYGDACLMIPNTAP